MSAYDVLHRRPDCRLRATRARWLSHRTNSRASKGPCHFLSRTFNLTIGRLDLLTTR